MVEDGNQSHRVVDITHWQLAQIDKNQHLFEIGSGHGDEIGELRVKGNVGRIGVMRE